MNLKPTKQKILATILFLIAIYIAGRISEFVTSFLIPDELYSVGLDAIFNDPTVQTSFIWFALQMTLVHIIIYGTVGYLFVSWLLNKNQKPRQ